MQQHWAWHVLGWHNDRLQARLRAQRERLVVRAAGGLHELHAQGSSKSITLSRDQIVEIQTTIDLFIEDVSRRAGSPSLAREAGALPTAGETHIVPTRN